MKVESLSDGGYKWVFENGDEFFFDQEGRSHRLDGPATTNSDVTPVVTTYAIHGMCIGYTAEKFQEFLKKNEEKICNDCLICGIKLS